MSQRRFENKVVMVTGAGHGIGRATAERFGREGARLVVVDINRDAAGETASRVVADGGEAVAMGADVSIADAVSELVAGVAGQFGRVDVVHNNAGRLRAAPLVEHSLEEWDATFGVNVRSMFLVCRELVPLMRKQGGGAIVNTASTSGLVGEPLIAAYSASKGAVINLTRQLAAELSRDGIRVNCVCPGWIPTGFNDPVLDGLTEADVQSMVEATVPLGRQGDPAEIAAAVAFLASDDASYIVGHALVVDGGLTACR